MNSATYTPAITKLIADSKAAGYTVTERNSNEHGDHTVSIYRRDRRSKDTILRGVQVYCFNGTFSDALRMDVRIDLATTIRTIKTVREILLGGK